MAPCNEFKSKWWSYYGVFDGMVWWFEHRKSRNCPQWRLFEWRNLEYESGKNRYCSTSKCMNVNHCVKNVRIRRFPGLYFSRIRTEYGEIRISPYSVRMWEKYGPEKLRIRTLFTFCMLIPKRQYSFCFVCIYTLSINDSIWKEVFWKMLMSESVSRDISAKWLTSPFLNKF